MRDVALMIGGVALGLVVLAMAPATEQQDASSFLELTMASGLTAGEVLEIAVAADAGAEVDLFVFDAYGVDHRRMRGEGKPTPVEVSVTTAGMIEVFAHSGDRTATAFATVTPAAGGPAPTPLVGARSIVADGADRAMVVVIPEDAYGNPTAASGLASVTVVHPDGSRAVHESSATATLQWTWVASATAAGTAQVTVDHAGVRGPVRTLVEIPAAPEPFTVEPITQLRPADGVTLVEVATTPLADRFDNRIVDGTAAIVTTRFEDGTESSQTAVVIGGVARALIEAPSLPGIVRVRIAVHGVVSAELALDFSAPLLPPSPQVVTPHHLSPLGGGK